jgi:PAS domain S-box-containing protein
MNSTMSTDKSKKETSPLQQSHRTQEQIEEALRDSEQHFRAIWQAASDAMALSAPDGTVLDANPAYYQLYGYPAEEVIGNNFSLIVPEEQRQQARELYATLFSSPDIISPVEAHIVRADGTESIVESSYSFIAQNGIRTAMLSIIRDITERKKVEELNKFKLISDQANDGIAILDQEGYFVYVNKIQAERKGYSQEEYTSMTIWEKNFPYDFAAYQEFFNRAQQQTVPPNQHIMQRKDGTTLPIEVSMTGVRFDGEAFLLCIARDITERNQAQERQERLLRYASLRADISQTLAQQSSLHVMLERCCEAMASSLPLASARLWIFNEQEQVLELQASAGSCTYHIDIQRRMPVETSKISHMIQKLQSHLINDVLHDPLVNDKGWVHQEGVVAIASYPLILDEQVVGIMALFGQKHFTEETFDVLTMVADAIAQGIGRKQAEERLEERVKQRTKELSLLLDVSHAVASTLELQPLLQTILEQLKTVVDYSEATLLSIQDGKIVLLDYRGTQSPAQMEKLVQVFEQGASYQQILQLREAVIVDDFHTRPPFFEVYEHLPGEHIEIPINNMRSWMGIPLIAGDRVIGILAVSHSLPNFYKSQHASLAFALANQAAIALENARLYERARSLAALQERQRLARELHDSVSQELYGISLNAQNARETLETHPGEAVEAIKMITQHAEVGMAEMRALLLELRPESLQSEGLIGALSRQVGILRANYRLIVQASFSEEPEISVERKHALYRIAQEALHNVVRHARATTTVLRMALEGRFLLLEVRDDGRGFDPGGNFSGHLGLQSIKERVAALNGTLTINSTPENGTTVSVRIPYD